MKYLLFILLFSSTYVSAQQHQDCLSPYLVCAKKTYNFNTMTGSGNVQEQFSSCFGTSHGKETNSKWLKFQIENSGTLTYVIDPYDPNDDLDFILYKSSKKCDDLEEIRCMASGNVYGNNHSSNNCEGSTGLSIDAEDQFESLGCKYNDDNFLKFLSTEEEEVYYLFINNYNSSKGFSISFDGDSKLKPFDACLTNTEEEELSQVRLFPSPAKDKINIEFHSILNTKTEMEILNMKGELLEKGIHRSESGSNQHSFDLSNFSAGSYLIRISQNNYSTVKKFIKL